MKPKQGDAASCRVKTIIAATCALLCVSAHLREAQAAQYSKLGIVTAAKTMGKWPQLKSWIAQADLQEEWDAAQYLSDDYLEFAAITNAICTSGIATAEEIATILLAARDTSVQDAMLLRVYNNDIKSTAGRIKWHGKVVSTSVDLESLTKTTVHEDGTVFVDEAKVSRAGDRVLYHNSKLPKPVVTNGIPARLAAARLRQAENAATTNEVTVTVTP